MAAKNKYMLTLAWVLALALCVVGCGSRSQNSGAQAIDKPAEYRFSLPKVPPALQGEVAREFLREHMWDGFDFRDTLQLEQLDRRMMTQAFAYYVATVNDAKAAEPMQEMMQRAATSKPMLLYFLDLAERVLHDPNSPARNDEKYIPVLEYVLRSPLLDEYEKMPYESDLFVASQNRVGRKANDINFTTADGSRGRMLELEADYTLIFISNPGCPMCRDLTKQISESELFSKMIDQERLKVLVIYPDEDLAAWREHLDDYPAEWINAYDEGQRMSSERTFDLRAIPALYLLDRTKSVMAKDCTDVGYIEKLISE